MEDQVDRLTRQTTHLTSDKSALTCQITSLQQSLAQADKKIAQISGELEASEKARREQRQENLAVNEKLVTLEEEYYASKTIQLDLLEQLKNLEEQFQSSLTKIDELLRLNKILENNQAVYIPRKSDRIDTLLAQFLNSYPDRDRLRISFVRESEGTYNFGQMRVKIRIDKATE